MRIRLPQTLAGRIALSYGLLTVALNVMLVFVLKEALERSLVAGADTFLEEMVNEMIDEDPPSHEEIEETRDDIGNDEDFSEHFFMRFHTGQGDELIAAGLAADPHVKRAVPQPTSLAVGQTWKETVDLEDCGEVRVWSKRFSDGSLFQVGVLLNDDGDIRGELLRLGLTPVLILTILAASIGWFWAKRTTRGVESVTAAAKAIREGELGVRVVPPPGEPEVAELALAFNMMLERIQELLGDIRRVSADMVHDLRSPLTRLRAQAECVLREEGMPEGSRDLAVRTIEETFHLDRLIDTTLEIISLDSGVREADVRPVDVSALILEVLELYGELIEERGLRVSTGLSESLQAMTDPVILRRVIANILDNAIKFSPADGVIRVALLEDAGCVRLSIADEGPGIPEAERAKVFDRFYRMDDARGTPGNGLGLSYVQAGIHAMGGSVEIVEPGEVGAEVRIRLMPVLLG